MIDDELRPAVIEFVAEMLNDPHYKSVLLDVGENAVVDSDLPVLYLDVTGKHCDYILSIKGDEYSGGIRYVTGKTRMIVEGETGIWRLRELLDDFRTRLREGS
jgi:hypothetical protein|nr:MAG TPA: hypothetical protein [Caudoviricetes sp.]